VDNFLVSALSPIRVACTLDKTASKLAHGGSIRLLLLAYECHVKSKFHVVRGGWHAL
jgi:hypothetical protein